MTYHRGDFKRICDVCGFVYRASQTRKRWDGLMVCFADYEERHPQDFVRGRADHQNVPDPRPEPVDNIIGQLSTLTTAAAAAGTSGLTVQTSVRFLIGDRIGVTLSDSTIYRATVGAVPDSVSLTLTLPLPLNVLSGAMVIDYSAISPASIG